jgi:hypothetical protein
MHPTIHRLFLIKALLLLASHLSNSQNRPQRVSRIHLIEAKQYENKTYRVTEDSIVVRFLNLGSGDTTYTRPLTAVERDWLMYPFDNTYLSTIRNDYQGRTKVLHDFIYVLTVHKGTSFAKTRLYKYKLNSLFIFCDRLNQLLPPVFHTSYTAEYFKD